LSFFFHKDSRYWPATQRLVKGIDPPIVVSSLKQDDIHGSPFKVYVLHSLSVEGPFGNVMPLCLPGFLQKHRIPVFAGMTLVDDRSPGGFRRVVLDWRNQCWRECKCGHSIPERFLVLKSEI
jgi:hypothetical protein